MKKNQKFAFSTSHSVEQKRKTKNIVWNVFVK